MQRIPESFVNTVVSQDRFKQWETEWTGLFTLFVIKTLKIDDSSENYMILQIVTHILRKAFFKPAPVREELS